MGVSCGLVAQSLSSAGMSIIVAFGTKLPPCAIESRCCATNRHGPPASLNQWTSVTSWSSAGAGGWHDITAAADACGAWAVSTRPHSKAKKKKTAASGPTAPLPAAGGLPFKCLHLLIRQFAVYVTHLFYRRLSTRYTSTKTRQLSLDKIHLVAKTLLFTR